MKDDGDNDERLGHLETEVVRLGERQTRMERDLTKIGQGVDRLLEREAARPEPMGWRTVIGTLGSVASVIAMMAFFSWWFIATSPTVLDLDRRLTRLDDRDIGRVTRLEKDVSWTPRVSNAK